MVELEDRKKRRARQARPRRVLYGLIALVLIFSLFPPGKEFWNRLCSASGLNGRGGQQGLLEIHVIDVGKADAILIRSQGHAALLDAGTIADGPEVVNYLARYGVEDLDYAIVSHPDADHVGGMEHVLRSFDTELLVESGLSEKPGTVPYREMQEAARQGSVSSRQVEAGDSFWLGAACFTVVGPLSFHGDANDDSLVLRLDCEDFSALFCGDAEKAEEAELAASGADLGADLLKVAHHGSETSTTQEFLDKVRPKCAVISVGKDRSNLPREPVLRRLEGMGVQVFRTDVEKDVVFVYDEGRLKVKTGKKVGQIW